MTTQVHISISGNKQVLVSVSAHDGRVTDTLMQPGAHHIFLIHGDGAVAAREVGGFVDTPMLPLVRQLPQDDSQLDLIKGVPEMAAADQIANNG